MVRQNDINIAKAYVLKRVQAELNMSSRLDTLITNAANDIIGLCMKYKANYFQFSLYPDLKKLVDKIILRLKDDIEYYTLEYSSLCSNDEDSDTILAFINGDTYGNTFENRNEAYTDRFKNEMELFVASGLTLSLPQSDIVSHFKAEYKHPFSNSIITSAKGKNTLLTKKIANNFIKLDSSAVLLDKLVRDTIGRAWMEIDFVKAKDGGAKGYYVFRGSSVPCQLCDDMCGYLHTMDENVLPVHPYCKCYMVYVY